jgi:hypothetical protein
MKPSYNKEACKALSFAAFKKLHENIDFFLYLNDAEWEAEYESATGKKVIKKVEKGE